MASNYSQLFTLTDIFNNEKLAGKLPLVNFREIEREDGKISARTKMKTVNKVVFDTAQAAAAPLYKPLKATRGGDTMILDGTLQVSHDTAVNAVFNALEAIKAQISWTANNMDMIRSALKETESNKRRNGVKTELYLQAKSMTQIEQMSPAQINALMNNIMENIMYGDDFPKTQKRFQVDATWKNRLSGMPHSFERRRAMWRARVGL